MGGARVLIGLILVVLGAGFLVAGWTADASVYAPTLSPLAYGGGSRVMNTDLMFTALRNMFGGTALLICGAIVLAARAPSSGAALDPLAPPAAPNELGASRPSSPGEVGPLSARGKWVLGAAFAAIIAVLLVVAFMPGTGAIETTGASSSSPLAAEGAEAGAEAAAAAAAEAVGAP